jgi:hypothetical protein
VLAAGRRRLNLSAARVVIFRLLDPGGSSCFSSAGRRENNAPSSPSRMRRIHITTVKKQSLITVSLLDLIRRCAACVCDVPVEFGLESVPSVHVHEEINTEIRFVDRSLPGKSFN